MVLKLDLKKAFDCIDWQFLRLILIKAGLGIQMANWIMACVTSPTYSVLINGEATDFFRSGRGLCQGYPLSPLLFILTMEGLSLILKKSIREGKVTGIKVSRLQKILHLLFVDDIIIMTKANFQEWWEIDKLISLFCKASGLLVNKTKTTVHYAGLSTTKLVSFQNLLPYTFSELSLGFKYLGYYLKTGAHKAEDWDWLVARLTKRINNRCNRWLSLGGR
jgi:hypothetical protein